MAVADKRAMGDRMETVQHIDHQAVQGIRYHLDHQGQKIGLAHQRRGLDQGQKKHEERDEARMIKKEAWAA